ncbi:choice-of-anchor Q domain-containing protein [Aerosakkonemataceae cyanobacterium BLCC-F154]|uniref:Choice-of-anchor Q domain-containing protein n=1 Tax=Floridaenema fluviatile BLCC-F154 TaxID=3153640 RepID=A0ABV4YCI0_9CYAN
MTLLSFNLSELNGNNGFALNGINQFDFSGRSVSSAGDINGDGIDDLIIGASGADPNGNNSGQSYVVFGQQGGFNPSFNLSSLNGNNGFVLNGINADDSSGYSVSGAGDINGDGIDDLIIGSPDADPSGDRSGQIHVVFGQQGGFSPTFNLSSLNGSNGFTINGVAANALTGLDVSDAGDINGDGIDDLIIGAIFADPNGFDDAGQSYVVFGRQNQFNSTLNLSELNGSNGFAINGIRRGDYSGNSVSSAGDINGDGFDDLIIGAYFADVNGQSGTGQSYVIFGRQGGFSANFNLFQLNGSNGFAINGINAGDYSGYSVSGAGDVNGDGFDDLIIGAYNPDDNVGRAYVMFGRSGGFSRSFNLANLNGNNGFTINGINPDDNLGVSVSSAGDVNGDGIDDLIIGADQADPNGDNSGQTYVVFGQRGTFSPNLNLADLNGSNGFALNGINPGDNSGGSVSGAGDVNADGIDDLIIGARLASVNGNTFAGQSYVVFGRQGGFVPLVDNAIDENDGDFSAGDVSLREAIAIAGNGATIAFSPTLSNSVIALTLGELAIDRNITIQGLGENNLTISGSNESRIFRIGGNAEVNIEGLTLANGFSDTDGGAIDNRGILNLSNTNIGNNFALDDGGGISNLGTLRLTNTTISNNIAEDKGGGIVNLGGKLEANNSIFSGNVATDDGGGIFNLNGTLQLISSTVTDNAVDHGDGGGIRSFRGTTTVNNTIIAGNFDTGGESPDVDGNFTSNGFNLIGISDGSSGFTNNVNGDIVGTGLSPIDPQLSDLQNNHAPLISSPAIDAGDPNITDSDRFGTPRPQGANVDIGAVEFQLIDNLTVDNLIDELDGDLSPGDVSLREAILATAEGGTIDFADSLSGGTIALTLGTLNLDKNLTIQGLGADNLTLDGNNTFRIFSINTNAEININGLTLAKGGNAITRSSSSAIFNEGTLNLSDSIIRDSQGRSGGGINNEGFLNVVNSQIFNNQEVNGEGGSGIRNVNTATLINTTVSNNLGSGIYSRSLLTINNSTIENNTEDGIRNDALLRTNNVTIQNNRFSGIRNRGDVSLLNSTISGNQSSGILNALTLSVTNSTISGNEANFGGGINNILGGTFTLTNSTIANNIARVSGGGIIWGNEPVSSRVNTPQIGNSIIAGNISPLLNTSDVDGNFISNGYNLIGIGDDTNGFINGENGDRVGTITNPIDPRLAPLADNGGATLTHALLAESPAVNAGSNENLPVDNLDLDGDGDTDELLPVDQRGFDRIQNGFVDIGAYESDIETRTLVSVKATTAEVNENTTDVGTYTLTRSISNDELIVNLSLDADNTATLGEDYTLEIDGTPINSNNSNFSLTFAKGQSELSVSLIPVDDIFAEDAETITLSLNESLDYAIDSANSATVTIAANDLTVVTNTKDSGIGSLRQAIINANNNPGTETITFEGEVFTDNIPDTITLTSGELPITDSLIIQGLGESNLVVSGNNNSRVFNVDDGNNSQINVTLDGLTIRDGNTTGNGGGIFNRENLTISNSAVSNNTAVNGGGISTNSGTLDIINSRIFANKSNEVGGGVQQLGNAIVNINNSIVNSNLSTGNGAGIDINPMPGGFAFTVNDSIVSNNVSTNGGGGGFSLGSSALVNVNRSIVRDNQSIIGGGIANRFNGQLNLTRTIVANNTINANSLSGDRDISGIASSGGFNIIGNGTGLTGITNGVNDDIIGAVVFGDNLYFLTPTATSWTQAQAIAQSFDSNLVTINDADESTFLVGQFGILRPWIGFNDVEIEGQFQWVSGEPITFTNWSLGEPNNEGTLGEDYAELFTDGRWNDLPITSLRRGIVEVNPNVFSSAIFATEATI